MRASSLRQRGLVVEAWAAPRPPHGVWAREREPGPARWWYLKQDAPLPPLEEGSCVRWPGPADRKSPGADPRAAYHHLRTEGGRVLRRERASPTIAVPTSSVGICAALPRRRRGAFFTKYHGGGAGWSVAPASGGPSENALLL